MKSGLSVRQRNVSSPPPNVWFLCVQKKYTIDRKDSNRLKSFAKKEKKGHKKISSLAIHMWKLMALYFMHKQ
jgi:hypothetical protein